MLAGEALRAYLNDFAEAEHLDSDVVHSVLDPMSELPEGWNIELDSPDERREAGDRYRQEVVVTAPTPAAMLLAIELSDGDDPDLSSVSEMVVVQRAAPDLPLEVLFTE